MRQLLILLALACVACEPQPSLWDTYDKAVHDLYFDPSDSTRQHNRTALTGQVEAEVQAGSPVPPGVAAHLGYLNYLAGNSTAAKKYFELERSLYPESARFMDELIGRL